MFTVEIYDPLNGQTLGHLKLNSHGTHASRTADCMKSAHFRSSTAAGLTRSRWPVLLGNPTRVTPCHCVVGSHYDATLKRA